MKKLFIEVSMLCLLMVFIPSSNAQSKSHSKRSQVLKIIAELNSLDKVKPTYLKRHFMYLPNDKFIDKITLFTDNYGQMPLKGLEFKGSLNRVINTQLLKGKES